MPIRPAPASRPAPLCVLATLLIHASFRRVAFLTQPGYHARRQHTCSESDKRMTRPIFCALKCVASRLSQLAGRWTQPLTIGPLASTISDLPRSRLDLVAENALLRHQLITLSRQVKRPHLTHADRIRLVLLARCARFWQQALLIVLV
jgi:hypothetical protein